MTTPRRLFMSLAGTLLALLAAAGTRGEEAQRSHQRLELGGYRAYHVRLAQPFTRLEANGERRTFTEAYVVRLKVSQPDFANEKVDFFVGDYRVPEYGGWAEGIYFKVYDRALFESLRGGELRYRIGDGPIVSFERRLELADPSALPKVPEVQLLPGAAVK
jgi:hypothetical protein